MIRMRGGELLQRHHHGRDARFHVGRATPVQLAVADRGLERRRSPIRFRAAGHHIDMTQEREHRIARSVRRPQVGDITVTQVLATKPRALQPRRDQRHASRVIRGQRAAADQLTGEIEDFRHGALARSRTARSIATRDQRVITLPSTCPTPKVMAAATLVITNWRAIEKASVRPVNSEVPIAIRHKPQNVVPRLANIAARPPRKKYGATGKIAPKAKKQNDETAALQAEPPSSDGSTPKSSRTTVSSAVRGVSDRCSARCSAFARPRPLSR